MFNYDTRYFKVIDEHNNSTSSLLIITIFLPIVYNYDQHCSNKRGIVQNLQKTYSKTVYTLNSLSSKRRILLRCK